MVREPHNEANDIFMWTGGGSELGSGENYGNNPPLFNREDSVCGFECIESTNRKIMKTPKENKEQSKGDGRQGKGQRRWYGSSNSRLLGLPAETRLTDVLLSLRPFGLCLTLTPSFLDLVEQKLHCSKGEMTASNYSSQVQSHLDDFASLHNSEKLKASNFSASLLKIGSWERVSHNEGDVVAKCYYAKRKLVWEILEGGLKRKIEIQWSDILSMEVKIQENEHGILHIELSQRPAFYEEIDPQPRKHTMWKLTTDFTGGEAYKCRRHYLVFPPGNLDKPYEKLLQCDERLLKLSKKPFPSLPWSPNFPDSNGCSFGYNASMLDVRLGMPFGYSRFPSTLGIQPPSLKETPSPISDEHVGNQVFENSSVNIWGQGMKNYGDDVVAMNQVQELMQIDAAVACQNYEVDPISGLSSGSCQELLSEFENHLFSDSEGGFCDENDRLARVRSWAALVNLPKEENLAGQNDSMHTVYDHAVYDHANEIDLPYYQQTVAPQVSLESPMVHPPYHLSSVSMGHFGQQHDSSMTVQICQQHDCFMPAQVSLESPSLHQHYDNFCYSHHDPDPSQLRQ